MRFIGNKELIVSSIKEVLVNKHLANKSLTFFDAFCGSGAVSDYMKDSFNIISNDMLNWSVLYTRGRVNANKCEFRNLETNPFDFFNSNETVEEGFFYKNYSKGGSERMYFSEFNASRIDYFRHQIQRWFDDKVINLDEYAYLMASLIESISTVSNTAGVYGAFLKHWDPRSLKKIIFKSVDFNTKNSLNTNFTVSKIEEKIEEIECDILYLDPPYTQNQYGTQYHILETLVLNDNPSISKITGSRSTTPMRSDWSKDFKCHILFDKLIAKTKAKYILFSYSKDGFMSKSYIEAILKRYGKPETYFCNKIEYKKYTNTKSREKNDHFEYLFFIEKKDSKDVTYESPLNYIGSKAKLIPVIKKYLPKQLDGFTDAFGGGFNVGINIESDVLIYNDLNNFVVDLIKSFKDVDTYTYIQFLKKTIKKYGLEPNNSDSYINLRNYYNSLDKSKRDPKILYAIILYGFNQQIRFNNSHDFNNPVGLRWFNDKVLEKFITFCRVIKEKEVIFSNRNYSKIIDKQTNNVFIYFDPPYLLTTGSYNDGSRGFLGWNKETENEFLIYLDELNEKGYKFMVSYVDEHKDVKNNKLIDWIASRRYNVIDVDPKLVNKRKEILITNYTIDASKIYNKK